MSNRALNEYFMSTHYQGKALTKKARAQAAAKAKQGGPKIKGLKRIKGSLADGSVIDLASDVNDEPPEPVEVEPERGIDLWLLAGISGLIVFGVVLVYSTSAVYALRKYGDSAYFLKRQLVFVSLGAVSLWIGAITDYRWIRRWTYPLLAFAFLLLASVLFLGGKVNGARRWFILGPLSFQPVEIAKLSLIAFLSYSLTKKAHRIRTFTVGFVPHILIAGIMMGLLLMQPDLGSAIILGLTTMGLLYIAGSRIGWMLGAVLMTAPAAYALIVGSAWRMRRLLAYFNPDAYALSESYQIVQAGIAIGSGGTVGAGLGQGRQQLGYLPEGHSDFVLAGIGEELGFIGIVILLSLFGLLVWRGTLAAMRARDSFGTYLAFGIILALVLQALFNAGVVLGVLPSKGITLPLVSYGGSSLVLSMYVLGVVLSVARAAPPALAGRVLINAPFAKRRRRRAIVVVS